MLVNYHCKKYVILLSTMHNIPSTHTTEKKKPTVIRFTIKKDRRECFLPNGEEIFFSYCKKRQPFAIYTNILTLTHRFYV